MPPTRDTFDVLIPLPQVMLTGALGLPAPTRSLVLFAHGSGSSRLSPRNMAVASALRAEGIGTLLFDLLTPAEDADYERRFEISLLCDRLLAVTHWAADARATRGMKLGYFGASTGSAAALCAAAELGSQISAVVSRGGRPDLAGTALARVTSPTLLIVGGADTEVLVLNNTALTQLAGEKELTVIPGATHLFEEPGALDQVAHLAAAWFTRYFG